MSGTSTAAWVLLFLLLVVGVGSLPVIKKVKKCSWIEAAVILLTWLGLIKEEPNQIMFDRSLGMRILEIVQKFTDVPKLNIKENIVSNIQCYQSGLPYIIVRFIPSPNVDVERVAYYVQDAFESHVAQHYPEHSTECFIETFKRDLTVCIQIRYAWTHEEEKILSKVFDRSLNCRETKAIRSHQRPSDQKLNQKLQEVQEKQTKDVSAEKKTETSS